MIKTRHLGVYGVVINKGKVLLVRKSRGAYIGKLDLPGGSFEHGETPVETLKREIDEETGSKVINYSIYCADSVLVDWVNHDKSEDTENMHHIGIIYDVEIEDIANIKNGADGHDSLGASWYEISKLTKEDVSPLTYNVLKAKGLIQ